MSLKDPVTGADAGPSASPSILRQNLTTGPTAFLKKYGFLVTVKAGKNQAMRVYVKPTEMTGGHNHAGPRPHGFLAVSFSQSAGEYPREGPDVGDGPGEKAIDDGFGRFYALSADGNGDARFYYVTPEIAGTETLYVDPDTANGEGQGDSKAITIAIGTPFGTLAESDDVQYDGQAKAGNMSHPSRFSGTTDLVGAIQALARNYRFETGRKLPVNDMSLASGGLLDTDASHYWDYVHIGHRLGIEVDIALASKTSPDTVLEDLIRNQGCWTVNPKLWAAEGNHYHLVLSGSPGVARLVPAAVNDPLHPGTIDRVRATWDGAKWNASFGMTNLGGADATGVTIQSLTIAYATGSPTILGYVSSVGTIPIATTAGGSFTFLSGAPKGTYGLIVRYAFKNAAGQSLTGSLTYVVEFSR